MLRLGDINIGNLNKESMLRGHIILIEVIPTAHNVNTKIAYPAQLLIKLLRSSYLDRYSNGKLNVFGKYIVGKLIYDILNMKFPFDLDG